MMLRAYVQVFCIVYNFNYSSASSRAGRFIHCTVCDLRQQHMTIDGGCNTEDDISFHALHASHKHAKLGSKQQTNVSSECHKHPTGPAVRHG